MTGSPGGPALLGTEQRGHQRIQSHLLLPVSALPILTDSRRGLQLTPLILYAGSHSPSLYLSISIPPSLAHTQLQPVH